MDIWTLGMILLHCVCLTYKQEVEDIFEELLSLIQKFKGTSLINFEEKINADEFERSQSKKEENSFSDHSGTHADQSPAKEENWIDFFATDGTNDS